MSNKTLYRYMQSTFYIYMNLSNSDYFHIPCNLCRRGSIHMIRNANCFPHIDNSYIFCNLKYGSNRYTYNLSHNDMHLCCKHKIWNIYNLYNVYIPGKKWLPCNVYILCNFHNSNSLHSQYNSYT